MVLILFLAAGVNDSVKAKRVGHNLLTPMIPLLAFYAVLVVQRVNDLLSL
jgi:hypothetical protein